MVPVEVEGYAPPEEALVAGEKKNIDLGVLFVDYGFPTKPPLSGSDAELSLINACLECDTTTPRGAQQLDNLAVKVYGAPLSDFGENLPERSQRQAQLVKLVERIKELHG